MIYLLYSFEYYPEDCECLFGYIDWKIGTNNLVANYDESVCLKVSENREDFLREKASLESTLGFIAMDDPSYSCLQEAAKNYGIKFPKLLQEGIMLLTP